MAVPSNSVKTFSGKSTVMGFRMIQCGRQTVSVIQPDGQIKQFQTPIKVSDLLLVHPHHCVTFASATTGRRTSGMLPLDTDLETGSMYLLLPLPRLFPEDPLHVPHLCACLLTQRSDDFIGFDSIKAEIKRHWHLGTPKISPENDESGCFVPRRSWEPDMEIILEDRILVIDTREEDVEKEVHLGRKLVNAISTLKIVSS